MSWAFAFFSSQRREVFVTAKEFISFFKSDSSLRNFTISVVSCRKFGVVSTGFFCEEDELDRVVCKEFDINLFLLRCCCLYFAIAFTFQAGVVWTVNDSFVIIHLEIST